MSELAVKQSFNLSPQSLDEALRFADILATSTIVPKDFIGNPGNILVAVQWGMELGLQPMQAMQSIAVINGRPSLWGDAVIALVRSSPLCEYVTETDDGETATCTVKRRGDDETFRTFSMNDAKLAGLLDKAGPWKQYPKRMRQMRARSFALRDVFPDVLRGMAVAEEQQDMEVDITPGADKSSKAAKASEPKKPEGLPPFPSEQFDKYLPTYTQGIQSGRKKAADVIGTLSSKYTLSEEQKRTLNDINGPIEGEATDVTNTEGNDQ
ncbi:recombinase RecT [Pseudomonas sp. UMAB-08]|uniref:recombinase RecT n=1 Tax=Pseudomonas sp. UMAB-08 TaxID=1365375 RepID=UPI001C576ACC|nr:recombinase RecT [Pseudomonas sp. UMAB-08]